MSKPSSTSVVFLDDDVNILKLIDLVFSEYWNVFTTDKPKEFFDLIEKEAASVAVSDYSMPEVDGITVLQQVANEYPHVRRILLSGNIDKDLVITSINHSEIHKVIEKPWTHDDLVTIISNEITEYNKQSDTKIRLEFAEEQLAKLNHQEEQARDEILELMIQISESDQVGKLTGQYISAIEGMQSLAYLNFELYLEKNEAIFRNTTMKHLSDIEVFANQYDQKILQLYIHLTRAYISLWMDEYEECLKFHKAGLSLFHWLSKEYIEDTLLKYVKEFPYFESDLLVFNSDPTKKISQKTKDEVLASIKQLLEYEVGRLVSISDALFYHLDGKSGLNYLIAVKNELGVYDYKISEGKDYNVSLISGFAVALTHFLEEVVDAKGDIETIKHADAVVMFHRYKELDYILLCSADDLRYRIALRQFAYESYEILSNVKRGYYTSGASKDELDQMVRVIFRL